MQPTLTQMRMALSNRSNVNIQNIGAAEAPSMSPKSFVSPSAGDGQTPPVGGVNMSNGMPVGGIDMSQQQAGQQMLPQSMMLPQGGLPQQGQPQGPQGPQGAPVGAPAGAPPMGNMLSMTPQGQALGAMSGPQQPPKPQGLAKGGPPKKPLHYGPSPVLKKSDIDAHAERISRQMAGLDNPNNMTIQQLARQKNLNVDIRETKKKKNVPVINFEEKKGAYSVGVPGDPSRGGLASAERDEEGTGFINPKAGEYLHKIGSEKMEHPVGLYGGKDYGAYGQPHGWASDLGASAGMYNLVKMLAKEDPEREIYGHYHKMSPESLNHAVHMMDAVLSYHRPHEAPQEKIDELNHLMRNVQTTKSKKNVPYPEFPGFENPNEVMLHGAMNSGMRKKLIHLLSAEKYFSGGKQKVDDLIHSVSHPELRNIETGAGGSSIIKFDPTKELRDQISAHPTYGYDIPSKLVGRTKYTTPAEILAPRSMHNAKQEIKAMGKKVVPFNQAKMNIIREPIDEQYINQMGEYEQAMRKRLGYKKGGNVTKRSVVVHTKPDTMKYEMIMRKKVK